MHKRQVVSGRAAKFWKLARHIALSLFKIRALSLSVCVCVPQSQGGLLSAPRHDTALLPESIFFTANGRTGSSYRPMYTHTHTHTHTHAELVRPSVLSETDGLSPGLFINSKLRAVGRGVGGEREREGPPFDVSVYTPSGSMQHRGGGAGGREGGAEGGRIWHNTSAGTICV